MYYKENDIFILKDDELRNYQLELCLILKDLIEFFENEGVNYSLSGGSILGAIRHGGFIPWDDDIDINIPRESYNKLEKIFNDKMKGKYYLQTPKNNPEIGILVSQIRKEGTIARRKYDWNSEKCGISIDIYIVENTFNNFFKRFFQKNISLLLNFIISSIREKKNINLPSIISKLENRKIKYKRLKIFIGYVFSIVDIKYWIHLVSIINSMCKDNYSNFVSIPTGRKHFTGEIYKRNDMLIYKRIYFENIEVNIPVSSEKYLKSFYGENYMKLPPLDKREKHLFLELKY